MNTHRIQPAALACAMGAASLWGLSFVMPLLLPGVAAFDVSIGRYLIYGLLAAALFARSNRRRGKRPRGLTRADMRQALLFAVTGYYGCYTALVWAIDLIGPAAPTLVMGLTPVSVALVGNLRRREVAFVRLLWPFALMGVGLACANLARLPSGPAFGSGIGPMGASLVGGLVLSLLALAMLTHFLVANLIFLKSRPHISPVAWANAIGVSVLCISLAALALRPLLFSTTYAQALGPAPLRYLLCCAVLGLGSSWLGAVLWNRANAALPAVVAGQCIVFWPLSGLSFAYIIARRAPGPLEALGVAMVFSGVVWGLRVFSRAGVRAGKSPGSN